MAISGSSVAVGWTSHPIYHVDREERRRWRRRDKRRKQKKKQNKTEKVWKDTEERGNEIE